MVAEPVAAVALSSLRRARDVAGKPIRLRRAWNFLSRPLAIFGCCPWPCWRTRDRTLLSLRKILRISRRIRRPRHFTSLTIGIRWILPSPLGWSYIAPRRSVAILRVRRPANRWPRHLSLRVSSELLLRSRRIGTCLRIVGTSLRIIRPCRSLIVRSRLHARVRFSGWTRSRTAEGAVLARRTRGFPSRLRLSLRRVLIVFGALSVSRQGDGQGQHQAGQRQHPECGFACHFLSPQPYHQLLASVTAFPGRRRHPAALAGRRADRNSRTDLRFYRVLADHPRLFPAEPRPAQACRSFRP